MHMEDLRHTQPLARLQHRAAEERESLGIVRVIVRVCPIQPIAIKERRAIHKVVLNSSSHAAVHNAHFAFVKLKRNRDGAHRVSQFIRELLPHGRIKRQIDRHLVALLCQLRPQRPNHVRQPAGLGKRNAL